MTRSPIFRLTSSGNTLLSVPLAATPVAGPGEVTLHELQTCSFEIDDREPDLEYQVWVGDRGPGGAVEGAGTSALVTRDTTILWEEAAYFEGARGRVWVRVGSRPSGADHAWNTRALLTIVVTATKLSDARYQAMVAQLRGLAAGLVFDLVSKMFRSFQLGEKAGGVSTRSSQVELSLIERLWGALAGPLQEVADDPVTQISLIGEVRPSYGGERLGARAVARLAAQGIDPRRPGTPRPFSAYRERFAESWHTPDHRMLLGMLRFLEHRVAECADDVRGHIAGIESDRPQRDRPAGPGPSLYESEDLPRVRRLQEALTRSQRLRERIRLAQHIRPLRGLQPLYYFPSTPVFEHVAPYHRIRYEFRRYLHSSLVLVDDRFGEGVKSTSRMYEQWVYFQLAAALRAAGLNCVNREGVFRQSRRFRFTLDLDRGATLAFRAAAGRAVTIRFEPWVLPPREARSRRDTLFRAVRGRSAWSPDVVIEFLGGREIGGLPSEVEYAVIVDAKYTGRVQEHHWEDTGKYFLIRATRTQRQVVRQVWLATPSIGEMIQPRDPAVTWGRGGPDCPTDEFVQGTLGLLPPERATMASSDEPGWIADPSPVALAFVSSLLAYLNVRPE
jgi:hypothetical protein